MAAWLNQKAVIVLKAPKQPGSDGLEGCGGESKDGDNDASEKPAKCPDTPEGVAVDRDGCPLDSDGDGVPNYRDRCPGTQPGLKVDISGCPPEIRMILTEDMVGFDFDKSAIKSSGKNVLDQLAREINENMPTIKEIKVVGHTDSTGEASYNQRLSERRAQAVVEYLVSQGIPADRIYSEGKGEASPIDSNSTADGQARNRRTEIDIKRVKE